MKLSNQPIIHKDDNIINSSITLDNTTEQGLSNNDTVIGKVYYGTPLSLDINTKDGYTYTITGDTSTEDFTMPERDAEVWVTSKESTYTVELVSNGGTFNYGQDNKLISISESDKSPTELSYVHYYTDDWTLPWVDSDNKAKVKNPDIKNQGTSLIYRDGYAFMGWSLSPVNPTTVLQNAKTYEADFDDTAEINYTDSTFKDKVAKLKESYKDKDISLDFNNDKGEVRLYAVWCPVNYVIRYHSLSVGEYGVGYTYIDTNNGNLYTSDYKHDYYSSVVMPTNSSSDTLGKNLKATFHMGSTKDFSYFRCHIPSTGVIKDEDDAFWADPDKVTDNLTKEGLKRIQGYNAFAIGVTTKATDTITDIDNREKIRGTWGCPYGLASYISSTAYVKNKDGKYIDVGVVDMYCEYTTAITVTWDGNAKYLGVNHTKNDICHYGESIAFPNTEFQKLTLNDLKGWDTDKTAIISRNADGTYQFDSNGNVIRNENNVTHKASETSIYYDTILNEFQSVKGTYYAQWTGFEWQIRYNANTGTGSMANTYMYGDEKKNLRKNTFTKTGKDFAGWKYDEHVFSKSDSYTVPRSGYYYVECWGADGGMGGRNQIGMAGQAGYKNYSPYTDYFLVNGGEGGYTAGEAYLTKGTKLTITVGKQGASALFDKPSARGATGGQATSIYIGKSPLAVAGGGAGASTSQEGGSVYQINRTMYGGDGNYDLKYGYKAEGEAPYPNSEFRYINRGDAYIWDGQGGYGYRNGNGGSPGGSLGYYYHQANGGKGFLRSDVQMQVITHLGTNGYVTNPATGTIPGDVQYVMSYYKMNYTLLTDSDPERKTVKDGYCRISAVLGDQESVSAQTFKDINPALNIGKNTIVDVYALWTNEVIPSCTIGITNVPKDMEAYYSNYNLTSYDYEDGSSTKKGVTVYPKKEKATDDVILPDLSLDKDQKTEIHDGFLGWQYYDYENQEMKVSRTVTLSKDKINNVKINGQQFIFTALWADHYAASIWGIDHDYNVYGVDNTTYGTPIYNKNKIEFNGSASNQGITFGAALGYNGTDSDGQQGVSTVNGTRTIAENDFDTKYVDHEPSAGKGCIHRDYIEGGWALIKKNLEDKTKGPSYYSECVNEGCTVPMFFWGNQMTIDASKGAKIRLWDTYTDYTASSCTVYKGSDSFHVERTTMSGFTEKGDGCTSITGPANDTAWQIKGTPDATDHYGGVGVNYLYEAYDKSNMPTAMNKIYKAILNPDLKSMIQDTDLVFATNSKNDTKGETKAYRHNATFLSPTYLYDSTWANPWINADMWWLDHVNNSGDTGYIRDRRSGNEIGDKRAYTYATSTGKLFLPSAREIYGDCSSFRGGSAQNIVLWAGETQNNSAYVLDFLDGNQFEKFKNYSFVYNLWNTEQYTTINSSIGVLNWDTYRLNSNQGVTTRTPGDSNTKARITTIDNGGNLNPTVYTSAYNGLTPCFRIK